MFTCIFCTNLCKKIIKLKWTTFTTTWAVQSQRGESKFMWKHYSRAEGTLVLLDTNAIRDWRDAKQILVMVSCTFSCKSTKGQLINIFLCRPFQYNICKYCQSLCRNFIQLLKGGKMSSPSDNILHCWGCVWKNCILNINEVAVKSDIWLFTSSF